MPKSSTPKGVREINFRGEKRYEAANETGEVIYKTPQEAEKRYRQIDGHSKAIGRTR